MISYNFKLSIFSIILGTLTLIYNYDCDGLYTITKYKNIILLSTRFRSLAELSYESRTNHKHEYNLLDEDKTFNETKYKKNKYQKDEAKSKQKILHEIEKENNGTACSKKYKKETYGKEKEAKSNRSSRSLKYLEMQRKLYNNFYVKPELDFEEFSNKSCECSYKNKSYNILNSSNNEHNNYLDNLKKGCVGGVGVCTLCSAGVGNVPLGVVFTAGTAAAKNVLTSALTPEAVSKLTGALVGVNLFSKPSIESSLTYGGLTLLNGKMATIVASQAAAAATNAATRAASTAFGAYIVPFIVPIIIAVVIIILYICLFQRRKNSLKHEWKKHLCT
ncbi:stevor [Plasmodium sp. gorilla clade G1]|nr:stevor [Plasmodium sp. gorilla clade G1]